MRYLLLQQTPNAEYQAIMDASTYGSPAHDGVGYHASPPPTEQQFAETMHDYTQIKDLVRTYQAGRVSLPEEKSVSEFASEKYAHAFEREWGPPGFAREWMGHIWAKRAGFLGLATPTVANGFGEDGVSAAQPIDVDSNNSPMVAAASPMLNGVGGNGGSAAQPIVIDSVDSGNSMMAAAPVPATPAPTSAELYARVLPPGTTSDEAKAVQRRYATMMAQGVPPTHPELLAAREFLRGIHQRLMLAKQRKREEEEEEQKKKQQSAEQSGQMDGLEVFSLVRGG